MSDTLTVGEAVDAYKYLESRDPSAFSREMLDQIIDAADALEPAAEYHDRRLRSHAQRIAPDVDGVEAMTDEQQAELQEVMNDVRAEGADVDVPSLDLTNAGSVAVMRELRDAPPLAPLLA
jgi:hypothetical protein